jgi:hypothetical protein
MDTSQIPGALPPAITISRETAAACLADDLEDYGMTGPVALAWQWALTGIGPTPIALEGWTKGPPGRDTLLDESSWPYADGWQGRASWEELQHARFLLWWLTAADGEETLAQLRVCDVAPSPVAAEDSSVAAAVSEVRGEEDSEPLTNEIPYQMAQD